MTIGKRLLWLLLGIAVIPLLLITAFYQFSNFMTRRYIATQTRKEIDADARSSLLQLVENYDQTLARESSLVNAVMTHLAREAEYRLKSDASHQNKPFTPETFGEDLSLGEISTTEHDLAVVDYHRQGFYLPEGVKQSIVADSMNRLNSMTAIYHESFQMLSGNVLWQYTTLENGLHTTYPQGSELPKQGFYDPRKRDWYLKAKEAEGRVIRIGPIVDAASDQVIFTIAKAVYGPDRQFAGVTAIDRTIPDLVNMMHLPQRWSRDAERFLVTYDSAKHDPLQVLLSADYAEAKQSWHREIELDTLVSEDAETFAEMLAEIEAGGMGIRLMRYRGVESLWVYGGKVGPSAQSDQRVLPMIIVPHAHIVELAHQAEAYVTRQSIVWLEASAFFLVLVMTVVVVVAIWKSRALVLPIRQLAQAGRDLSKGDYSVKVDIQTGDELQELGMVFNEVGPKLQQVERMQRSMELAGAIQKSLLPKNNPTLTKLEMAGRCRYCDETGGDYYDFIELVKIAPGKIGIALGDVSGHGIGAALLMANVRSALRAVSVYCGDEPSKMLKELNLLMAIDTEDDKFMTLFYGIFDEADRSLVWASAGHDPALWYHFEKETIDELPNTGIPLGILDDQEFDEIGPVYFDEGDLLVIGTDGIWETQNADGAFYGKERLEALICSLHEESADKICAKVIEEVVEFGHPNRPNDDVTVVAIKCL